MFVNGILLVVILGFFVNEFHAQITVKSSFSCGDRPSGYYADTETGCQVYHMCDGLGRQFSYSCPNATLFQQRMLICDHWYMVDCSKSESDYRANLLIGQRDKPFVDDSEKNVYLRTPRPDFLTNANAPAYNVIYRNGRTQYNAFSLRNLGSSSTESSTTYFPNKENEIEKSEQYKLRKSLGTFKYNDHGIVDSRPKNDLLEMFKLANSIPPFNSIPKGNVLPLSQTRKTPLSDRRTDYGAVHQSSEDRKVIGSTGGFKNNDKTVKELQKLYLIPDFQFPLETVYRPGYENGKSSFHITPNLSVTN